VRALIQRISEATVSAAGKRLGESGQGLLIFLCAMRGDTPRDAETLAARTARLRILRDCTGRMNRSLLDTGGSALVISQFTLAADTSRGNRPGFSAAAPADAGKRLYLHFVEALRSHDIAVATGCFGADMAVSLINDGPVTIWLDTSARP